MLGLLLSVFIFNFIAYITNKKLTLNQVLHIWIFTIAFQQLFDLYIDVGYHAYWYFSKSEVDWESIIHILFLVPPVNIIFLNLYPMKKKILHKILFVFAWNFIIVGYEWLTLFPSPWGYFHYGWWKLSYSFCINPILLFILIKYYKLVTKLEKKSLSAME
ncbi:hypothetical protein [Niallia sp. FSL W8-0635]|uniref:hypothetical protein n=1 Tax=Niallia sp. FSL W8-0635 TaxID=2975337 RepID=UPI0009CAC905|nr:Uncharacterised protein [Mycobacteroides abscessus subsp. abscessus]HEO8418867.1 hypothetical protein [Yersinia enterocolitica]